MNLKDLDNLKYQYEEQEVEPSLELWSNLEGKLDAVNHQRKPKNNWWKYAAAVVFLISFTSFILWSLYDSKDSKIKDKLIVNNKEEKKEIQNDVNKEVRIEKSSDKIVSTKNTLFITTEKQTIKSDVDDEIQIISNHNPIVHLENSQIFRNKIPEISVPMVHIAENKERKYINSSELLMGAEMDKARDENRQFSKKIGSINLSKIRLKPQSLQLLGIAIVSDTINNK